MKAAGQCQKESCWQMRPPALLAGVNKVENKKAPLLVIAHKVDTIELVVVLPTLCHKVGIPYSIIKEKAKLGWLAHRKTRTTVACTQINS